MRNLIKSLVFLVITMSCCQIWAQKGNNFVLKGFVFGVGGGAVIQQSKFNNTDFTGISDFQYTKRLQWQGDIGIKYFEGDRWCFGATLGMREAGWDREENSTGLEPYDIGRKYNFLYAFVDASFGYMPSRKICGLNLIAGMKHFVNARVKETVLFSDESKINSSNSAITPNKQVTTFYAGIEYRILYSHGIILTAEYECIFGVNKYNDKIIAGTQVHHALTLNVYPAFQRS